MQQRRTQSPPLQTDLVETNLVFALVDIRPPFESLSKRKREVQAEKATD